MKRLAFVFAWVMCTLLAVGQDHMMFRHMPIDGPLKTGMKQVRKMGFSGIKIDNVGMLMGTFNGEEVMLTLMATPKTKTLFCVAVMYDGYNTWEEALSKLEKITAPIREKYGEPTEIVNEWEEPYSIDNNPMQALKEDKGDYAFVFSTDQGEITVGIAYDEGKLGIIEAYVDQKNYDLFEKEGGDDFDL